MLCLHTSHQKSTLRYSWKGFAVALRLSREFRLESIDRPEVPTDREDDGLAKIWKYLHSSENDVG